MIAVLRTIFSQGFRALFLAAGLFAVVSMTIWGGWLAIAMTGGTIAPLPDFWHAHEMIFGYAGAVLGGFFLTAVPAWTGAKPAGPVFVTGVVAVWLAGRLAVAGSNALDPAVVAAVDLGYLALLAVKIGAQLAVRPKPQNVMVLGLLAIIWTADLVFHLGATGVLDGGTQTGLRAGLFGFASVIAVIGGRVAPAFTRNAMAQAGIAAGLPRSRRAFELPGIVLAIALPVLFIVGIDDQAIAVVAIGAGTAQVLRLAGWRTVWTLGQPILWSLHLGFAMLGAGYVVTGLAYLDLVPELAALHLIGIGAVGGMTLAVMSRAILGHVNRPLVAARPIALAYLLVAAAAVLRAAAPAFPAEHLLAVLLASAALWIAAFALFVVVYWPIVTRPGD